MKTLILKTNLINDPKIFREVEILESSSLYELAEVIIDAYNFDFDHCFGFFSKIAEWGYFDSDKKYELFTDLIEEGQDIEPTGAGSVKKTRVSDVWQKVGDKMMFLFDYGANWQFVVKFRGSGEKETGKKYPRVTKRAGRAPRQY